MANDIEGILKRKLERALGGLPKVLANEAVNHSLDAFKSQSWEGEQWRRRNHRKGEGRSILIKSGRLRRATRAESITDNGFVLVNDTPYAKAHNDGFTGTVQVSSHSRNTYSKSKQGTGKFTKKGNERMKTVSSISGAKQVKAHSRKLNLPRRRFMGRSNTLIIRLIMVGKNYIMKQLNS